nr:C-type lectin domain family 2 member D-like isoform X1 [Chrysemys picta bellii]
MGGACLRGKVALTPLNSPPTPIAAVGREIRGNRYMTGGETTVPRLIGNTMKEERPQATRDPALSLQCIRDQKIPIALGVIIAVLVSVIIALAVRAPQACPPPISAACPDDWIGNRGKCYFFSKMEGNWTSSQSKCSSLSASLAVIDSPQDLDFMLRYKGPPHHWIGLWKELDQPWKWPNGTEFNNMFPVRGEGQCAFLDDIGVSSSRCYSERGFICSRPDDCTRRKPSAARGDTV